MTSNSHIDEAKYLMLQGHNHMIQLKWITFYFCQRVSVKDPNLAMDDASFFSQNKILSKLAESVCQLTLYM